MNFFSPSADLKHQLNDKKSPFWRGKIKKLGEKNYYIRDYAYLCRTISYVLSYRGLMK
jgi:hypothetical protein